MDILLVLFHCDWAISAVIYSDNLGINALRACRHLTYHKDCFKKLNPTEEEIIQLKKYKSGGKRIKTLKKNSTGKEKKNPVKQKMNLTKKEKNNNKKKRTQLLS